MILFTNMSILHTVCYLFAQKITVIKYPVMNSLLLNGVHSYNSIIGIPPLSIARYSFMQLSELRQLGLNEIAFQQQQVD